FMASLMRGTRLVALDPFEWVVRPRILLDAIERYRTTFCWLPNFAFSHIVRSVPASGEWDLGSIRAFINCSEPCKAVSFDRFAISFAPCGVTVEKLQICYALAENVFAATQTTLDRPVRRVALDAEAFENGVVKAARERARFMEVLSCGRPVDGVEIRIADERGHDQRRDRIGEVALRSPFLFEGYYRQPEVTRERLRDGWYFTGDMGFVEGGELFVTGRKDDMIVLNGRNYYAHEIETVVNGVAGVLPGRCVAIGVDDWAIGAAVLVVIAEFEPGADRQSVSRAIRAAVLDWFGVAAHAVVPASPGKLVKTTSGKLSRTMNKSLFVAGAFDTMKAV
ncbi:MAG: AMP-binding protein, partial [Candidatus Eremiobacteraeota bacterium]|nr:AMP-binding protein [Candidatus Eremiobacteraeota bacterium]